MAFVAALCVSAALVGCEGRKVVGADGQHYYNR